MTRQQVEALGQLRNLLGGNREELAAFLREQHPADLAEWLEDLTEDERTTIFTVLDSELAAMVLGELELETQADLVSALGTTRAGEIIEEMATDEAADLLAELSPEKQGQILGELEAEDAADVRELLEYNADTAGGIMTTEYITLLQGMTAQQAIDHLRQVGPDAETIYYVYVVDRGEKLVGVMSLRDIIVAKPTTLVREVMRTKVLSVFADQDQEEVARTVSKYDLTVIPVVTRENRLVGVITVDDVIDVLEEEATEDALRISGVTPNVNDPGATDFTASVWKLAKPRLPWLVALLFLEMVSGQVVDSYQGNLSTETIKVLLVFMTVMAGESGNAATQALAVVVRGLAIGEIQTSDTLRVVWRELKIGLLAGVICGAVLFGIGYYKTQSLAVALTVGIAIAINIPVAKVLGAFFPVLITRLGIDPAVASGPFITSITDVTSMVTFFGLATVLLTHL